MVELALIVLTHLKNQRIESPPHPSNRDVLQRQVISNVQVVRARKNFLRLLKTNSPLRILSIARFWPDRNGSEFAKYNSYTFRLVPVVLK